MPCTFGYKGRSAGSVPSGSEDLQGRKGGRYRVSRAAPTRASLTPRFQWIVATEMKISHVLPQYMLQACLVHCFTAMLTHTWVLPKLSLVVVCNGPIVTCDNLSSPCAGGFWCFDCRCLSGHTTPAAPGTSTWVACLAPTPIQAACQMTSFNRVSQSAGFPLLILRLLTRCSGMCFPGDLRIENHIFNVSSLTRRNP